MTIDASHADVYVQNKPLELTLRQALLVSAYTGVLCCKFSTFHEFIELLLDRPVFTHELADPAVKEAIRLACKDDFLAICDPTL